MVNARTILSFDCPPSIALATNGVADGTVNEFVNDWTIQHCGHKGTIATGTGRIGGENYYIETIEKERARSMAIMDLGTRLTVTHSKSIKWESRELPSNTDGQPCTRILIAFSMLQWGKYLSSCSRISFRTIRYWLFISDSSMIEYCHH